MVSAEKLELSTILNAVKVKFERRLEKLSVACGARFFIAYLSHSTVRHFSVAQVAFACRLSTYLVGRLSY